MLCRLRIYIYFFFFIKPYLLLLQMALQPGVGLGLLYNMPPGLSVPCSISPFVYTHLSQVHGHVMQPSHSWSSSSSCCIQLIKPYQYVNTRWVNAEFLVASGTYLLVVLVEVKREKEIFCSKFHRHSDWAVPTV